MNNYYGPSIQIPYRPILDGIPHKGPYFKPQRQKDEEHEGLNEGPARSPN